MTASSTWVVTLPSSIDGVPTAIIAISDFATASAVSVVAARRPAATCPATSSSRPFSQDRGLAGVDLGHLVRVDVDADDGVTVPGQAGAGHATDVAQAEHRNIAHDFSGSLLERKGWGVARRTLPRSRTRASTSRQIASNWRAIGSLP